MFERIKFADSEAIELNWPTKRHNIQGQRKRGSGRIFLFKVFLKI
jgi:hypothetical protein